MKLIKKQKRYKNVDRGIRQLKRIQRLYGIDQFMAYFFGLAAVVFLIISIVMGSMTAYSFLMCSGRADGRVQRMEAREFDGYGNSQVQIAQETIQSIIGAKQDYPVLTYEVNHKTYTHKSSSSLNLPDNIGEKNYTAQMRYEPMNPEHAYPNMELTAKAIRSMITCISAVILLFIAKNLKKPGKMYLKAFARMQGN